MLVSLQDKGKHIPIPHPPPKPPAHIIALGSCFQGLLNFCLEEGVKVG